MELNDLQEKCHYDSVTAGWWEKGGPPQYVIPTKMCLIHSEISEAMEGYRKGKMDDHLPHLRSVEVELADAVIRILDLAEALGCNLEDTIHEKMAYNKERADHKLENRAKEGGKKF